MAPISSPIRHHSRWNVPPLLHGWDPTSNKIRPPPVFCFIIYSISVINLDTHSLAGVEEGMDKPTQQIKNPAYINWSLSVSSNYLPSQPCPFLDQTSSSPCLEFASRPSDGPRGQRDTEKMNAFLFHSLYSRGWFYDCLYDCLYFFMIDCLHNK